MSPDQIATKSDLERIETLLLAVTTRLDQLSPPDVWFSIADAAAKERVSEDTIRRRIREGSLEAKGSGKMRRVRLGD